MARLLPTRHVKLEFRGWSIGVLLSGSQRRFAGWSRTGVIVFSWPLESWRWAAFSYRRGWRREWVDRWPGSRQEGQ